MRKITIAASVAALMFSGAAVAQTGWQKGERGGDLTRAEALAKADAQFQRMDVNNDGRITREEMQQARQQMSVQGQQRMQERMAQMTPEQRAAAEQRWSQRAERGGERGGDNARRWGNRSGGEARGTRMFGEQGFITHAQFRERALQRFDRMDLNNDGIVTAAERQQARQQRRAEYPQRRGS